MKKLFLTMLSAVLMAVPASAQIAGSARVNVAKLRDAVAKSDAEIANSKNAAKAAVWLKRGDTFLSVDAAPVGGLYATMPESMLKISYGDAVPVQETIGGETYSVYVYPHAKAYLQNGAVSFFVPVTVIDPEALDKAYESFDKAYTIDPKTAKKAGEGMSGVRIKSFEDGGNEYQLGNYKKAAVDFRRAFKASEHPAYPGAVDSVAVYYAGMSSTYGGDYQDALADLDKALEMGYELDGDVYYQKFLNLYYLDRKPESLEILQTGMGKYPGNEKLMDMVMRYYGENEGDPSSIIPIVESAIAKNPNNPSLYQGLARTYDKLGQFDNAIATIKKAVALTPDDWLSNYLEGFFFISKGDAMNIDLNKQTFTSRDLHQQALNVVNDVFRDAVAPLEKAHTLNPGEIGVVELLKNLTFRLREDPGMQEKYDKYSEILNSAAAQ